MTVFDVIKRQIIADRESVKEFLAAGGAKDYSEYREIAGKIRAYDACVIHIEDLAEHYLEDDDDE